MTDLRCVYVRLLPLTLALALLPLSFDAAALSRRDQARVDELTQRMVAAEARYRAGLVKIGNADPSGQRESDAALEDMEDVVAACGGQKGCQTASLLTVYKRLLKSTADAEAQPLSEHEDDPLDADPDHNGPDHIGPDHIGLDHAGNSPIAASVPEAARAANLLDDKRHRFDQMVQYNPAVQAGIRRWLTDLRGPLLTSYENYQVMRHLMWPQYERAALPEALLFGIMAKESNGKVHATSRAGAAGPMQFMYATGKRFGLGQDATGFDTRYDPRAAAEASVAYLNERMGQLNRSIEMSLAAYNGGEGRALRVYQGAGGRSFWDADVYNQFPPETQDYVPMVIAAAWLFLHPKQYGLSLPNVDAKPAPLRLARAASIYELTICLGNSGTRDGYMRTLRNLNPRYEAESWIPAGATINATTRIVGLYNRWCVQGPRAALAQRLVQSDPGSAIVRSGPVQPPTSTFVPGQGAVATTVATGQPKPATPRDYAVQGGETLSSIARKFQCSVGNLARANDLRGPRYAIRPGQRLKLDGCRD